ncbi:MAG: hypothetical protein PHH67_02940 [Methanosarcina sp.]|nr:hypothetical protein [Methanosarcina sp.]
MFAQSSCDSLLRLCNRRTPATIETKPKVTKELKLPECFPANAYYPTNYSKSYNDTGKEYTLALEGLTFR